jgi:DNA (cytosine-5)-methyltransferase 1
VTGDGGVVAVVERDEGVGLLERDGDNPEVSPLGSHRPRIKDQLVLSLFPGLDLLGAGFEAEGFCVVKGPDPVWGSQVQGFRPPPGRFDGVIGGPPCQVHSELRFLNLHAGQGVGDLVPEFCRVVSEAKPAWWVMENVPTATTPVVAGYAVTKVLVQALDVPGPKPFVGAEARRRRVFWAGFLLGSGLPRTRFFIERAAVRVPKTQVKTAVLAGHGPALGQRRLGITTLSLEEAARLQGLPDGMLARMQLPYRAEPLRKLIGNGVPVHLARAVARGVIRSLTGD